MPYIVEESRDRLDDCIDDLAREVDMRSRDGELNYIITRLISRLYAPNYTSLNSAIGVLECAKQELYRRVVAPYEDTKIKENGDVYT